MRATHHLDAETARRESGLLILVAQTGTEPVAVAKTELCLRTLTHGCGL